MTDSPAAQTISPTPGRRWPRRLLIGGVGVLLVLCLLLALLPTLLSTAPGRNVVLGVVNGAIDGKVEAESLSLSWFGGQRAAGVNVAGPRGTRVLQNLSLEAPDVALLPTVFGSRRFGTITAHADAVQLAANEQGELDLPAARADAAAQPAEDAQPNNARDAGGGGIDTRVNLTVGRITFERPGEPTQTLTNFDSGLEVRGNRKIDLRATADVPADADAEPGKLDATITIDQLTDAAGKVQAEEATVDADVKLIGIPTPMVAALAGQDALTGYVGPTLTTTLTAKGKLANFTADAVLPDLTLPAGDGRTLRFADGTLNVTPGEQPEQLALTLRGRATTGDVSEAVSLDATLWHLFDDEQPIGVSATTKKLPVPLVDAIAAQDGRLTETLGDLLDLQVTLAEHAEGGYALSGSIDAPNLAGPFEGRYHAENLIALSTPSPLRLNLTARAYDLWTADAATGEPANVRLAEAMAADLNVPGVKLVLRPTPAGEDAGPLGMRIDPAASTATLKLTSKRVVIERREPAAKITLTRFTLDEHSENLNAIELVTQLETLIEQVEQQIDRAEAPAGNADAEPTTPGRGTPGKVTSRTTIRNLFDERGVLALRQSTIESTSTLDGLPADLADVLADQNGTLAATTGPIINGTLAVNYQPGQPSSATAKLDATHLKGTIPVRLAPDLSEATLADDIDATLWVTEQTSKSYLGSSHPLLADAVSSDPDKPVNVTIKKEDVRIPLDGSFDIKRLTMRGTVDPGTLNMKRSGWINQAISATMAQMLRREPRRRGELRTYPARFSPMDFTLKDGILDTSELWLVSDDMGMGFQGKVNLNNRQIEKMAIGILGGTFYAFGGGDVRKLDPDAVIEVPLKGAITSPKLDTAGLFVTNLDSILDVAAGSTDEETAAWINLGKTLIEGAGRARQERGGGKYAYSWNPSDAAELFAGQFKPAPAEEAADADQPAPPTDDAPSKDTPTEDQPAEEAAPSREPSLRDFFEQIRRRQQQEQG